MDQLKTQLAAIKQHSFWAMCIGILGVTLGSWWYSTGQLKAERDKQKTEIDGAIQQVSGIQGTNPQHPNATTNEEMEKMRLAYAQEVQRGWDLQYNRQASILVWPESFAQTGFRDAVDKLRPIEAIPVTGAGVVPFSSDLAQAYKEEYRNFIEEELPKWAEIIGARWQVVAATATGGDAAMGGMGGAMPGGLAGGMPGTGYSGDSGGLGMSQTDAYGNPIGADTSIVRWDPANQQEILNTHYGFTALTRLPTTLEILYAQEDYWVLTNLMNIIAKTNDKATAHHEAAIKYLDFVRIGRSAAGLAGQITPLGMPAGGMMAGGMGTDGGMPMGGGEPSMPGDPAAAGASPDGGTAMPGGDGYGVSTALLDPAEQRYVDEKYQPLTAARLRGALKSQAPEDAMLAVAKRMPVRLRVRIDQRRLNVLIAECGNSALPVEVRQVRINRPPAAPGQMGMGGMAGGDGGGMGGMPGGFSGGMGSTDGGMGGGYGGGSGFDSGGAFGGGMPGGGMPGGGMMTGDGYGGGMGTGMRSATQDASIDPNLIEVELYGIVYIYNPANKAQLGLEAPPAVPQDGAVSPDGTVPTDGTVVPDGTTPTEGVAPTEGTAPEVAAPPAEGTPPPIPETPAAESPPPAAPPPATTPTGAEITGAQ